MYRQFNIQQFYVLPTLYLCVLCGSENKHRLFPYIALTDFFYNRYRMLTARYGLYYICITQICVAVTGRNSSVPWTFLTPFPRYNNNLVPLTATPTPQPPPSLFSSSSLYHLSIPSRTFWNSVSSDDQHTFTLKLFLSDLISFGGLWIW